MHLGTSAPLRFTIVSWSSAKRASTRKNKGWPELSRTISSRRSSGKRPRVSSRASFQASACVRPYKLSTLTHGCLRRKKPLLRRTPRVVDDQAHA